MTDRQKLEPLTTRIPVMLGNKLRIHTAKKRKSIQEIVTRALEEYLSSKGKKKKSESRE